MRVRLWLWSGWWRTGVALVTAIAGLYLPASASSPLFIGAEREAVRLAAVPEPPAPPRPPTQPDAFADPEAPAEAVDADPAGGLGTEIMAVPTMTYGGGAREHGS